MQKIPKILIIENAELCQALEQVRGILPDCEIVHNTAASDSANVLIGNIAALKNLHADNAGANFIGLDDGSGDITDTKFVRLKKPYRLVEIVARLNNILATYKAAARVVKIGNFMFNAASKNLLCGDKTISLTEKEAALIGVLNAANGRVVGREELLKEVWGYDAGMDTHTLETHIYRIRQKLGRDNNFISNAAAGYFISKSLI